MKTTESLGARISRRRLEMPIGVKLAAISCLTLAKASAPVTFGPNAADEHFSLIFVAQGQNSSDCASSPLRSLNQALIQGRTEQARVLLTGVMHCPRLDRDLLFQAGLELEERELYPEAARVFGRCVQDYPGLFACYYNLALAQLALQRPADALGALRDAPRGVKEQELGRSYLRGKIYEALDQPDRAERDLWAALSGAPEEEHYALDLGLFYIRQRAYARAATVFERGAHYHPSSPFLLLGISVAQFMGGHERESVETCKKLLALDPSFSSARLLMAFALYMGGDYVEAEKIAAEGLRAEHPHPYLYYAHAATSLKLQSKDYDRMLTELGLASSAIPRCTLCYFAESKVYQGMGKTAEAIADLEKVVAIDPGYSAAWYRLAAVYKQAGRHEDAAKSYAQFRESKAEKSARETDMIRDLSCSETGEPRATQNTPLRCPTAEQTKG